MNKSNRHYLKENRLPGKLMS
uniref:Uncharacterized protein n=1 Tax=Anguilla anguilla TaxID=7936 RepID=A0A0E9T6W2_ANGAN